MRDRACHTKPVQPAESVRTWTGRRTRLASSPGRWPTPISPVSPEMAASSRAGEGLPSAIGEAVDGVEAVAALVLGRRLLLVLRVDLVQRAVDVEHRRRSRRCR